jgi:hypothetical protein
MASGVFGIKTLQDNWFEDRAQPEGSLSATANIHRRKAREYEPGIAYIGERYDVLSRISRMPNRPSYATPEDGFRENTSTNKVDFAHPITRKEFVRQPPPKPTTITRESVPEVSYDERRPVDGQRSGFGALLNRHEANHDQRFFDTTVGEVYGYGEGFKATKVKRRPETLHHCGVSTEHEANRTQGMLCGQLCGENYKNCDDPTINSHNQRAWLYQPDAALRNIHFGGSSKKVSGIDNALSLPLGEGAMAQVREDLKKRGGKLYRQASTITKGLGSRSGINIFQDG